MSLKSNYINGILACQNLGDCSLFTEPTDVHLVECEENSKSQEILQVSNILKKISAILVLSLLMCLIILV